MSTPPLRFNRVYIEITDRCPLACSFCPGTGPRNALMSPALFARIAAQCAAFTDQVCLHVLGEPLVHPQFAELLDICAHNGLRVVLTTNGALLDAAGDALGHPALRQINISMQAALELPQDRQAAYWPALSRYLLRAEAERPDLYINLRLWTQRTRGDAANDVEQRALTALHTHADLEIPPTAAAQGFRSRRLRGRLYFHRDTQFTWPADACGPARTRGFCHALSTHFAVLSDGTVVPCCLDHLGLLPLGNAAQMPLAEILQGPRAVQMRQGFSRGALVESLCQRCTYAHRFRQRAVGT
ncbi:MAG: radical SAM protein [Myxococcales bacterium]|jgi:MoaA/NifB/PqqE/SkfB family radical SAM enzyme|nr:radical SAM protein [Myxococcales bacterium]